MNVWQQKMSYLNYLSVSSSGHFSFELPSKLVIGSIVHELARVAEAAKAGLLEVLTDVRSVIPSDGRSKVSRSSLRAGGDLGGRPVNAVLLLDELCVVVDAAVRLVLEVDALFALTVGDLAIGVGLLGALENCPTVLEK